MSEENTELACTFIQKTAVEKALPEMDKRLASVSEFLFKDGHPNNSCHAYFLRKQNLLSVCFSRNSSYEDMPAVKADGIVTPLYWRIKPNECRNKYG